MLMFRRLVPLLLLLVALSACAVLNPPEKRLGGALDDFRYALRWQRFPEAAAFFTAEHRQAFLDRMEALRDLNITEVRLRRLELKDAGQRAQVRLEMDYYILPSATLKTLRIDQTWVDQTPGAAGGGDFLITTPFPDFP